MTDISEAIKAIESSEDFLESWRALFTTDAHERIPFKTICAAFYFQGAALMAAHEKPEAEHQINTLN
jgi:hypothetical protein